MFKVFRSYAKFLLLAVIAVRHLITTTAGRDIILNAISDWTILNSNHQAIGILSTFTWTDEIDLPDNEIDEIAENLLIGFQSASTAGDYDIITKVVDFLGLPFAQNRISPSTLSALRTAILRPSEIAAFSKATREALNCNTCHHKLAPGEILTFQQSKDGNVIIHCTNCLSPRLSRCQHCQEAAPISSGGLAVLTSSKLVSCGCVGDGSKTSQSAKQLFIKKIAGSRGGYAVGAPPPPQPPGPSQSPPSTAWHTIIQSTSGPFGDNT